MDIRQQILHAANGDAVIKTDLDVTNVLNENEQLRRGDQSKRGMKLAARVDMPSLMRWGLSLIHI